MVGPFWKCTDLSFSDLHGMDLYALFMNGANLERANLRNTQIGSIRLLMNERRINNELTRILTTRRKSSGGINVNTSVKLSNLEIDGRLIQKSEIENQSLKAENKAVNKKFLLTYSMDVPDNNLRGVNLKESDLAGACLAGVLMNDSDLTNADLSSADLCGADLRGANLCGADFKYAVLSDESLGAIQWDKNTNWTNIKGLESAIGVPDGLKRQLGIERP